MQREKVILKAVCLSMQDQDVGSPINTKAHKKHRVKDNRMKKLSSELFTRTIGVPLLYRNITSTVIVRKAPTIAITVRVIPIASWERNSTTFGTHTVPSALDQ